MKHNNDETVKGNLSLFGAGVLFGASSPVARIVGQTISPSLVVLTRFVFSIPFLAINLRGQSLKTIQWKSLSPVAILGSISPILFTLSLFYTKISLSIFYFYVINMIASILIGRLFNNEVLSTRKILAFCVGLLAVGIIGNIADGLKIDFGSLLATLSGVTASLSYYFQKR